MEQFKGVEDLIERASHHVRDDKGNMWHMIEASDFEVFGEEVREKMNDLLREAQNILSKLQSETASINGIDQINLQKAINKALK